MPEKNQSFELNSRESINPHIYGPISIYANFYNVRSFVFQVKRTSQFAFVFITTFKIK